MNYTFMGCDISLNHGAIVTITPNNGISEHKFWYFTDKKTHAARYPTGYFLDHSQDDPDILSVNRIAQIKTILEDIINKALPDYAAIEGYAYNMKNQAHQLGEVGGLVRSLLWQRRIPFRIHDPKTVKKFGTGNGNSDKKTIVAFTWAKWKTPSTDLLLSDDSLGDIADATILSHMAYAEYQLKNKEEPFDLNDAKIFLPDKKNKKKKDISHIITRPWTLNTSSLT